MLNRLLDSKDEYKNKDDSKNRKNDDEGVGGRKMSTDEDDNTNGQS